MSDSTLASRLRESRSRARLGSRELSVAIGGSPALVSQVERGATTSLKAETALALAEKLGVSVEWLVTGVEKSTK